MKNTSSEFFLLKFKKDEELLIGLQPRFFDFMTYLTLKYFLNFSRTWTFQTEDRQISEILI